MNDKEVAEIVNKIFAESFEIDKELLRPEAHIFNDLGLDSLDMVDLIVGLQKSFGVKIQDNEKVRSIRTLKDIYQFISDLESEFKKK